jgi:predicted RNase H-like HicB family nuclease
MPTKSRKSAEAVDRPFVPKVLAQAKTIARQYQVIVHCEDDWWYGRGLELPNILGDGRSVGQCVENTQEALAGYVAYLLEKGQKPPSPSREGTRTQQVNVRLTAEEKLILESTAKRKGFQGLSDFIRAAAVESAK